MAIHTALPSFSLRPDGPFTLDVIRTFQCGIFKASRACDLGPGPVKLAFTLDDGHAIAGVTLRHVEDRIDVRHVGAGDPAAVARQVARILCVDHDARPFARVLATHPALAAVAARHPGFRPVCFFGTYAAGAWAVLGQRLPMVRAAQLARAIAAEGGDVIDVEGETLASFPRPETILARPSFPGISAEKWLRLQTIARAAVEGALDADHLRRLGHDEARARLRELRGVGPWTADAILIRGLGSTDVLPLSEPALAKAAAHVYGAPVDLETVAATWAPFRTWVSILLCMDYYRTVRG